MSIADTLTTTADIKTPRAVYFDMYTQPGSIYMPMNIEIIMPETVLGNSIPAATVCSVKLLYVGVNSQCAQRDFINAASNGRINYYQRMAQFKNDKAIVSLDSLCNSGDPTQTQDPVDGLIRLCNLNFYSKH